MTPKSKSTKNSNTEGKTKVGVVKPATSAEAPPKAKQVVDEGSELTRVEGSVMQMEVPKREDTTKAPKEESTKTVEESEKKEKVLVEKTVKDLKEPEEPKNPFLEVLSGIELQLRVMNGIALKNEIQNKTPREQKKILDNYASFGKLKKY